MSWFGKKDNKNDAESSPDEPILLTVHGVTEEIMNLGGPKQVDLTATAVIITSYKNVVKKNWSIIPKSPEIDHIEISKVKKIPRKEITGASWDSTWQQLIIFSGKSQEKIKFEDMAEMEKIFAELDDMKYKEHLQSPFCLSALQAAYIAKVEKEAKKNQPWYLDSTKLSHVATYKNAQEATNDANSASALGWMPQSTATTDGHLNVGRTATEAVLTGGLTLLLGASRTNGSITVTYVRTPQWVEQHKKDISRSKPVLTIFCSDGFEPCKIWGRVLDDMATEFKEKLEFKKIDVNKEGEIVKEKGISLVPAFILEKNGVELNRWMGANSITKDGLISVINEILKDSNLPQQKEPEAPDTRGSIDVITQLERLAKLRDQGILTDEEFQQQKIKIMNT